MLTTTYGLLRAGMSRIGRAASTRRGSEVGTGSMSSAAAVSARAGPRAGGAPDMPLKPAQDHLRTQFAADLREVGTIPPLPLELGRRPLLLRDPVGAGPLPQEPA